MAGVTACSEPEASAPPEPEDSVGATSEPSPPEDSATTSSPVDARGEDPGVPELPAEAMEDTETGAEAFVQYYIDLLNYVAMFPRVGLLEQYGSSDCGTCSTFEKNVEEQVQEETFHDGPSSVVEELDALPSGNGYRVFVTAEAPAFQRIDKFGQTVEKIGKGKTAKVAFDVYMPADVFIVEAVRTVDN